MIVARRGNAGAQNALIAVDRRDDAREDEHEEAVVFGRFAGVEQVEPRIGGDRPVVVLARTVDVFEGFFVEKAHEAVTLGDLLHDLHRELIVVDGDVGRREDGRKFVLRGRDFVVLGLGEDAVLPQRLVEIAHIGGDARFERAEVMIFHLLPARRARAEEGAPR